VTILFCHFRLQTARKIGHPQDHAVRSVVDNKRMCVRTVKVVSTFSLDVLLCMAEEWEQQKTASSSLLAALCDSNELSSRGNRRTTMDDRLLPGFQQSPQ
jgi:hypothetical protein